MSVSVFVGTVKGGFLLRSDARRGEWSIEGPLFAGWRVTSSMRRSDGEYLVATASPVYGAAIHKGRDLHDLKQVEMGPRYEEESGFKLREVWRMASGGEALSGSTPAFRSPGSGRAGATDERERGNAARSVPRDAWPSSPAYAGRARLGAPSPASIAGHWWLLRARLPAQPDTAPVEA